MVEDTCVPVDVCDNYAFFNPGNSTVVPCPPDFTLPCYNGQALPGASRFFRGIQFTAQKQLSDHWMLYASYLYSTLRGNFDGSYRAIGGFNSKDPNITDDFDYPEFEVNANGPLTLDRPHQAKLQAAYVFPFNLTFSASAYYLSGTPLSKIGWWDGYGGPELFLAPRGSQGRSPDIYEIDLHLDYGLLLGPVTRSHPGRRLQHAEQATGPDDRPGLGEPAGGQRVADADQRALRPAQHVPAGADAAARLPSEFLAVRDPAHRVIPSEAREPFLSPRRPSRRDPSSLARLRSSG